MAEEGQSIGNLVVGVDLDFSGAREQLNTFASSEIQPVLSKAGRAGTPGKTAATGGVPVASAVNADLKINGKDIVAAIDKALDSHEFKLLIDQTFLRNQIEQALKGLQIPLGAAPGQARQESLPQGPREVPPDVAKAFNQVKAFPDAASDLFDELQTAFKSVGKKFSGLTNSSSGIDKTVEIVNQLGGSLDDIYQAFASKPGTIGALKNAAKIVEQNLGVSGDSAKNIAQLVYNFKKTGAAALPAIRPFAAQAGPTAAPVPVSVVHEDRQVAKTTANVQAEAVKLNRLETEARSNLAPIRVGRTINIGDLVREARTAATSSGPSVSSLLAAGLASEGGVRGGRFKGAAQLLYTGQGAGQNETSGIGDLLSRRRPLGGRGQTDAFGRAQETTTGTAGRGVYSFRPSGAMTVSHPEAGPRSSSLPRLGEDPEADIRALDQLGLRTDRGQINYGALRKGTGAADVDLRSLAILASQGQLSNFVRNPKTGEFTRLEPTGVAGTQERFDSEARIRDLLKSRKRSTIPGIEGQVVPQSPGQIISAAAEELFGAEGTQFLQTPRVQAELKKAIRAGSALKQDAGIQTGGFKHLLASGPSEILAGIRDQVEAEQSGTGIDRDTAAANRALSNARNQERIASGFGLTRSETADRRLKEFMVGFAKTNIAAGALPDFTKIPEAILGEVQAGNFVGSRQGFASQRVRQVKDLLLKGGGADLTGEKASQILGLPVTDEQAALFQGPIPNARRLKPILNDVLGGVVSSISPAPGRKALTGSKTERAVPFERTDANQADVLTGRGVLGAATPTTLGREEASLRKEIAASPTRISEVKNQFEGERGVEIKTEPIIDPERKARLREVERIRSAARNAVDATSLRLVKGEGAVPIPGQPTGIDAITARAGAIGGLFGLGAEGTQETQEILQGRAVAARKQDTGKVKYASGDVLRRAAAKTATVAGEVESEEDIRNFTNFNAAVGSKGTGRGIIGPPGGAPPAGTPAGGGTPPISDGVRVFVTNWPEGIGGGGRGGGPISQNQAGTLATSAFRANRADLGKQTSASAQAAFGRDVEKIRTQLGLSDAQIKKLAQGAGLGVAAEAFFPTEESTGTGGFGGAGSRSTLNARRRRLGLAPIQFRTQETLNALDEADVTRSNLGAEVRRAQRFEPRRGFTASVTDIFTNLFPFIERQQAAIGRFSQEATQQAALEKRTPIVAENLAAARTQVEDVQALITKTTAERDAAKASGASSAQVGKFNGQLRALNKELTSSETFLHKATEAVDEQNLALADQAKRTQAARSALPGAGGKLAAFGAGFTAAAGAVAVGQLVAGLAMNVMSDIATALGPAIDRAAGSPAVTSAITKSIATAGAPGTFAAATAQLAAQAGTGPGGLGGLTQRGQALAGNANLIAQFDLIRGNNNIARANQGLPSGIDRSVLQGTGGIFGSGIGITGLGDFQLSAQQAIAEGLANLPTLGERTANAPGANPNAIYGGKSPGEDFFKAFPDAADTAAGNTATFAARLKEGTDQLDQFNKDIKSGGSNVEFVFAEKVGKTAADVDKFADSLKAAGAPELADAVRKAGLVITGAPATGASGIAAVAAAQRAAAGFNVESLLAAQEPARRAQEGLRQQRIQLTQNQVIPGQFGISNALAPLPTGAQVQGLLPGRNVSGIQSSFSSIGGAVDSAVQGAKDFVSTNLPGYGEKFAAALNAAAADAKQISNIQIGVQIEEAQLSADKYAYSLTVANRSLADAKGLTGEITNANKDNLGVIERQQFLLGRESQSLQLTLSQLQINFQKSLAGFVAPGATPEERAARIKEAEKEAKIAQEQLDIQKKQFALGGRSFTITASRQVRDLEKQVQFLQRDYSLQLDSKAAQLQVQALSKDLDLNAQKANALFNEAVQRVNDVYAAEASLVAATGKGLGEVANQVLTAFGKSYNQMLTEINSGIATLGSLGGGGGGGAGHKAFATGGVFRTSGKTDITVGEAAGEEVAILANPRSMIMPQSGGQPVVINITVSGNKFSTEEDERRLVATLTTEVQRQMGRNAALLGLRRPI